jgi:uncharacterized protein (TIGR00375 family)
MEFIADLHIHSRHSRATSTSLDLKNLEKYARIKGVNLLGTGDFTHPKWIEELRESLAETESGSGVYQTKTGFPFVFQTELSLIYTQDGKGRKVHNVVLAPSLEVAEQITEALKKRGRVDYDGRPIFGIPCPEFVEMMKQISADIEIIPAHVWTPHFGALGASSGFNSIKECFLDTEKHIHALETGLSSDPAMNWRISSLDKYTLVSFSDLHSFWPWRLGREATVFNFNKLTYQNILKAIKEKTGLVKTIEFWPHEGKYHFDGHRNCNVCLDPAESIKLNNKCPKCSRPLTIGVAHRVEELADRPEGFTPKNAVPFETLIPMSELLSKLFAKGVATKYVWEEYYKLLKVFENEYSILLNVPVEKLKAVTHPRVAEILMMNRNRQLSVKPGYDGVYGDVEVDPIDGPAPAREAKEEIEEKKQKSTPWRGQSSLMDF